MRRKGFNSKEKVCKKCNSINWSSWTSSSTGKVNSYCKTCRRDRAKNYEIRRTNAKGSHTRKQWLDVLQNFERCPICDRIWTEIPARPDKRYKYVWTKDHIIPLTQNGGDNIENIQPLCYQCNFGMR